MFNCTIKEKSIAITKIDILIHTTLELEIIEIIRYIITKLCSRVCQLGNRLTNEINVNTSNTRYIQHSTIAITIRS